MCGEYDRRTIPTVGGWDHDIWYYELTDRREYGLIREEGLDDFGLIKRTVRLFVIEDYSDQSNANIITPMIVRTGENV